jgi:DNA-binding NarL/FixJ family response regulator
VLRAGLSRETKHAVELLQEVMSSAFAAQALRLRDLAAREPRTLGVRVSSPTRRGEDRSSQLSPREQEVAALVADGKANREVAAALFVSEKTVEYHLSNIYEKLGLRSRVELAGRLARLSKP